MQCAVLGNGLQTGLYSEIKASVSIAINQSLVVGNSLVLFSFMLLITSFNNAFSDYYDVGPLGKRRGGY
jgi:hypothetical protein